MSKKFTDEQEQQICSDYFSEEKLSPDTLGKNWDCSAETIRNIVRKNGYTLRTHSEVMKNPKVREKISKSHMGNKAWNKNHRIFTKEQEHQICIEYFSEEKPSTIILSKKWNCSDETIRRIILRSGYKLRNYGIKFTKSQKQQICNEYFSKENLSLRVLAKMWGCDPETIRNIIVNNGLILKSMKEVKRKFSKKQENQICDEYFSEEKLSTIDLAWKWGCMHTTIMDIIKRNGYKLRTSYETLKDPKVRKKLGKKIKEALSDPEVRRKICERNSSPEAIKQSLKNGFGINCYYDNEFFPSLQERDCYIELKKLGFKIEHNFENRFDFLVNDKIVLEYHPYDLTNLTDKQYYMKRRKLLDDYGHENLKLIVIKNLKEIENFKHI
jgi:Mor family transcriptional regulator